jgi:hypothetical protein
MYYPEKPALEEKRVQRGEESPAKCFSPLATPEGKIPQVARFCEEIKMTLESQDKIISDLKGRLGPVLVCLPKTCEVDLKEGPGEQMVAPLAECLREISRIIKRHNVALLGLMEGIEV